MALKTIAVTGATGSQGGGVINIMKNVPGWQIRAITRNPSSKSAVKLSESGIEVVRADFDDESSLVKAFDGVHAIFAVTNWWEYLFSGKSQDEAGEIEHQQGMNLARAAAKISSLEHYIWSSLPSAETITKGKLKVPHMDYKANVDVRIKAELPELAAKTTYLLFGYYPANMAFLPMLKPVELPSSGQFVQIVPTKPEAKVLNAGDVGVNPGIWVRQILAHGDISRGKNVNLALEKLTFQEMIDIWSEVTGKKGAIMTCSLEDYRKVWGVGGYEFGLQLKFGEMCDPWEETEDFVTAEALGIDPEEVVGFKGTIEGLKSFF
ncbi:related to nitrogen metabolic regulation protein nmr [Fusarium oxysporum]|uniref:Related to nitrogen metabolic regulation protein nmr n=1 Tax=Fusarium oxysporum TaxID=5507 RepID=A0A2H3TEU8_FUSOX|nr:related to nitrogen metabolic regulation protein nmr [Fusarium oxysporum]